MRARVQATVQVSETRRRASLVMIAVLVALLLLSLFIQVWALPTEVGRWVSEYPVLEPLATPGIIWEVVAIACWQFISLLCVAYLVLFFIIRRSVRRVADRR